MIKELNAAGYTYAYEPAKEGNALTLLLLHGTGGDHTSFIGLGRLVSPGAALIALKGNVNENGNLRFFRRHGEGVYDMDDLAMRTLRLADAIPELLAEHGRDPAMVVEIPNWFIRCWNPSMSARRGRLRRVSGSSVRRAQGSRVSAAFFAPEIWMVPESGLPPRMMILSIAPFSQIRASGKNGASHLSKPTVATCFHSRFNRAATMRWQIPAT